MKKFISIMLALCLLMGCAAWAETVTPEATETPKAEPTASAEPSAAVEPSASAEPEAATTALLPSPEEVSAMEAETSDAPEEDAESEASAEPEVSEEPEASAEPEASEEPEASAEPEATPEPSADTFLLWFEEGFGLSLPEGWVSYDVDEADGVRYALGDGLGTHYLYIQLTPTDIEDVETLAQAVDANGAFSRTGSLSFGGVDFISFIDSGRNASCCATLWSGDLLVFIFTPQSDSDYMLEAARMMETFTY